MKSFTFSLSHWAVMIIAVVSVAYVSLYFTKAEAVYSRVVGTISVTQFVPNAGTGDEFVSLAFSGIAGQDSVANLEGWSLQSDSGMTYDLSSVVLTNEQSVKICEEGAEDPNCTYHWSGSDAFSDSDGGLHLIARDGTTVVHITYGTVSAGQSLGDSGNYIDDVYTPGDKVSVCEMQKNGKVVLRNTNVQKLTKDIDVAIAAQEDIVPPFVYERNKTLNYHPGVNWPAGKASLEAGCQ